MTSEEIAELLHVDPVTIRRLVNKGELSAYRIGADYRFSPSDLQNYLQRQRIVAHAQSESETTSSNPLNQFAQLLKKVTQGKHTTPAELMSRFNRFTKRLRHVLVLAQEEAVSLKHNYIGTEHLLLGLIREKEGIAAQVLANLGVDIEGARHSVETIIGSGDHSVTGEAGLTPRSKKVIEFAIDEARLLNHQFIGTEHLLLGLVREGHGIAAGVLEQAGLQLEQVRVETLRLLGQHPDGQEDAPVPASQPVPSEAAALLAENQPGISCPGCGARSPLYFRHCFNCGQALPAQEPGSAESGNLEPNGDGPNTATEG